MSLLHALLHLSSSSGECCKKNHIYLPMVPLRTLQTAASLYVLPEVLVAALQVTQAQEYDTSSYHASEYVRTPWGMPAGLYGTGTRIIWLLT